MAERSAPGLHLAAAGLARARDHPDQQPWGARRPRRGVAGGYRQGPNAFADSGAAVQCRENKIHVRGSRVDVWRETRVARGRDERERIKYFDSDVSA